MDATTVSNFRKHLKDYLEKVYDNKDVLIINRKDDENVVVISLDEYNSFKETEYLMSTEANREHLRQSVWQLNEGQKVYGELSDEEE